MLLIGIHDECKSVIILSIIYNIYTLVLTALCFNCKVKFDEYDFIYTTITGKEYQYRYNNIIIIKRMKLLKYIIIIQTERKKMYIDTMNMINSYNFIRIINKNRINLL